MKGNKVDVQVDLIKTLPRRIQRGRPRKPAFLAVDFFCGAGGTTRGLIDAGGYVIAGLDKQESCRKTYVANNGNEAGDRDYPNFLTVDLFPATKDYPTGQQDKAFSELDELIEKHRTRFPKVPLLFAICAPCQPFTKLNKAELSTNCIVNRLRDRDLLMHTCHFIEHYEPDLILSENVAGITDSRYGGIWEDFINCLRDIGYSVATRCVCASNFGIPQYRKRYILAAIRTTSGRPLGSFEIPEEDISAETRTVKKTLEDLPSLRAGQKHEKILNHVTRNLSDVNKRRISYAQPGESNSYLTNTPEGDLSLVCHRRVNKRLKSRCFTDVYTRMAPDRPSPTITTRCHSITNGRFGHYDPSQLRGISMREAARLQSFRDDYVFYPVNKVEPIARMIGNAVPPVLATFLARQLVKTFQSIRRPKTLVN